MKEKIIITIAFIFSVVFGWYVMPFMEDQAAQNYKEECAKHGAFYSTNCPKQ